MEASEIRKMGDEVRGEDPGRAAELYRQASDLGDADASSSLGYMYIVGEGVPQDTVTAAEYLKRASDLGNTKAMCNLGIIMMGIDPSQALTLFERAAESGYEKGMINAATMLRGGNGVAADPERAVMWLERAAATSTEAAGILAHILRTGEGVFPNKPRAAELYRMAAEAGDPDSQYDLAMMLDAGDGIPVDRVEAERWFRASADQGDNDARLCIGGILYERGEFSEAEGYFTDAALDGDVKAMYNLALMLMDGSLGERDENKAMEWMEMASDAGFVYAQSMLGSMLINRDIERAETLLRSASDAGEPTAMYNLGALALSGRIEMPDRDAIKLLTASAEAGICEARDLLMRLSSQGMLRSLVPDQQIIQAGDLVPAGQVLGHESVWTLDYGAVNTEGVRRPGIVVAVADEERPVAGDVEPRERERHRLGVGLVGVGVVPPHDCLGDVPEPLVLQKVHDLVAHLPRHDPDALAPVLEGPQDAGRLGERLRLPVGVRGHRVVEPGAILVVGLRTLRIRVEDVVHGHPEVPRELLPAVIHADDRQHLLQDPVYAGARVVQGVVEVEEVEVVLPHFVPT